MIIWNTTRQIINWLWKHAPTHEDGGVDEISLTDLSGDPADTINESLLTTQDDIIVRGASEAARLNIAAQRLVGRITSGHVAGLTVAQVKTLLAIANDIATHAALTTGTHGVGAGTISSISTANKSIYVDKEATGAADGTSWTDAFTTFQDAIDSMEDVIIHAYTIYVRDGTKKTGTADSDVANKLHDTGEFTVATTWVGRRVFNVDDGTWGVVSARDSDDQLSIVDIAGAALDLFPDGDEAYVIEPTPYRETVYLNSDPTNFPAHSIKGSLTIRAEHYWYGACVAQANAGEIYDASADFTNVEVGDRVFAIDNYGADGEYGTVDDVSQVASHIVRTTLTKTPTSGWTYAIVKTEISGSDDGLDSGTARNDCFYLNCIDNVSTPGFYMTFSDGWAYETNRSRNITAHGNIFDNCDFGAISQYLSQLEMYYCYFNVDTQSIRIQSVSSVGLRYSMLLNYISTYLVANLYILECFFNGGDYAVKVDSFGVVWIRRSLISANVTTGLYARYNAAIKKEALTNNATVPEDPTPTSEGAYIG